jgi:hypothetical protein
MSHIEDRWCKDVTGPDGKTVKQHRERYGTGLRWRVRYIDPDGAERSRSFRTQGPDRAGSGAASRRGLSA